MPSGQTHDLITLWTLPLIAGATLAITRHSAPTLLICGGYLFGGLMLGPDLDIHSVQYKRWGWLRWIWIPYRGSLCHRSPFSHGPIWGTTIRVVYLLVWLAVFTFIGAAIANELLQLNLTWLGIAQFLGQGLHRYAAETIAFGLGLELGAFSHYTADWWVSSRKQRRKQQSKTKRKR